MESEKVKEIKKAIEYNSVSEFMNRLPYADEFNKLKMASFDDILTLINELEKENAKLLDSVETVQSNRCVYKCVLTKEHLTKFAERLKEELGSRFNYIDSLIKSKIDETLKDCLND